MANNYIVFNGANATVLYFNGVKLDNMYHDGVLVYAAYTPSWKTVWTGSVSSSLGNGGIKHFHTSDFGSSVDLSRRTALTGTSVCFNLKSRQDVNGSFTSNAVPFDNNIYYWDDGGASYPQIRQIGGYAHFTIGNGALTFKAQNEDTWYNDETGVITLNEDSWVSITITKIEQFF